MKRINIFPGITINVSDDMIEMLDRISASHEIKLDLLDTQEKNLLKTMFERNLLVRRRKNNEVSYSIRPGLSWH